VERRPERRLRPILEVCEPRVSASSITDMLASQPPRRHRQTRAVASAITQATGGFVRSPVSIAVPENQNPQGVNLAIAPTGVLTPREQHREQFVAVFQGTYTIGPGRTSTEAMQTHINAVGTSNTMLHCDIQLRLITPRDPATQIGGVAAIFDRNLNSNSVLGLDVSSPQANVDAAGRPNKLTQMSVDVNLSAGVYDEAFSQGVMQIRYIPSARTTPGVIEQGHVIVVVHAQIYTAAVGFVLGNSSINP
jgi:hypothetical protein